MLAVCSDPCRPLRVHLAHELVRGRNLIGKRSQRGAEPVIPEHYGLEHEGQVAKLADRRPLLRERRFQDRASLAGLALLERMHRPVEHQRDPGELLHGAVVQEERQSPPLVLLGRDQPLERVIDLHRKPSKSRRPLLEAPLVDHRFAQRDRHGLRAGVGLELREDVADVALHRLLRDEEPSRRHRRSRGRRRAAAGSRARAGSACPPGLGPRGTAASAPGRRSPSPAAIFSIARTRRPVRSLLEDVALGAGLEPAAEEDRSEYAVKISTLVSGSCSESWRVASSPSMPGHPDIHDHDVRLAAERRGRSRSPRRTPRRPRGCGAPARATGAGPPARLRGRRRSASLSRPSLPRLALGARL